MSRITALTGLLVAIILPASVAVADADAARALLKDKGLMRVGSYYFLPGETQLAETLEELKPLQHKIKQAKELHARQEAQMGKARTALLAATQERNRLQVMLAATPSCKSKDCTRIILRMNEVTGRMNLLRSQMQEVEETGGAGSQVAQAREEYTNKVLTARRIEGETRQAYARLASDAQVSAAIEELARAENRKFQLGPRRVFDNNTRSLNRYAAALRMGDIELREDRGVYWVDVVLNGNVVKPMVFDTGASLISLPADYAEALGLRPSDADPVVMMQIADGSFHQARQMTLESVRVGEFSAEAVECVVLPPDMKDAPPLLGQSFINNFSYQIHPASNKLTLTALKK